MRGFLFVVELLIRSSLLVQLPFSSVHSVCHSSFAVERHGREVVVDLVGLFLLQIFFVFVLPVRIPAPFLRVDLLRELVV